ncbi:MAG: hypothetical protein V2I56_22960 [Desulfobacteraceae bacterium]|jgi:hypothetical protein|nr:hypothetical protein [Desulfobacteraceae bacterium]
MVKPHLSNKKTGAFLIFFLFVFLWSLVGAASAEDVSDADLDNADLVEFSSHIMSIDYGKDILVVAEKVVMIVDLLIGGEQFTTQVTNSKDEVISIDSLSKGQTVSVQGLKLDDGRVVAARVRLQ